MRLVHGVGVNDRTKPAFKNGKPIKEYKLWAAMLKRCYSEKYQLDNSAYIGCTVSDNFKNYSYFYDWCHKQIGFNLEDWHLDKDLLIKGNRQYHEDKCLFLPSKINTILEKNKKSRGDHPIGVYFNKDRGCFVAYARIYGKFTYLGGFDCEMEAFNRYKDKKEEYIKHMAETHCEMIDVRAYKALMSYCVEFGD